MDSGNVQLQHLCRVCFNQLACMLSLFGERRSGLLLAEMLAACTLSRIDQMDTMPSSICLKCADRMYSAYEFCQLAKASEAKLQQLSGWAAIHGETSGSTVKTEPLEVVDSTIAIDPLEWTQEMAVEVQLQKSPRHLQPQKPQKPRKSQKLRKLPEPASPANRRSPSKIKTAVSVYENNENDPNASKRFECYLCKMELKSIEEGQTHLRLHADGTPHQCQICSMRYSRKGLDEHLCRGRSVKCDYCADVFHTTLSLLQHLQCHKGQETSHKCRACCQRFPMKFLRDVHRSAFDVHRPFQCEHCCRQYNEKYSLKKHCVTHSKLRRKCIPLAPFSFGELKDISAISPTMEMDDCFQLIYALLAAWDSN